MEEKKTFDFQVFINDSKEALMNPKEYFARIKLDGGFVEPVIKALIYGAIGGFITQLWLLFHINASFGGMFGGGVGFSITGAIMGIIWGGVFGVIGAFIGGLIILIISSICNGNNDYEANFRVAVALMVIYPISAFVGVFGVLAYWLATLASVAVSLYSLYMLYFAVTLALKGKEQSAKTVAYVLGGILIFFVLIGMLVGVGARSVSKYGMGKYEKELKQFERAAKEMEKAAGEYTKDLEGMLEEMEGRMDDESDDYESVEKPSSFPQKAADKAADWFYKGKPVISKSMIGKVAVITEELKYLDSSEDDEALLVFQKHGYANADDYSRDFTALVSSFTALQGLVGLEQIMNSPEAERKAAETYAMDQVMAGVVKQSIENSKLTMEDMKVAYNNWDELSAFAGNN